MKAIAIILLFSVLSILSFGQGTNVIQNIYGFPAAYRVSTSKSKTILILQTDRYTKFVKAFNRIPNDTLGNIVFLKGTRKVDVTALIKKDSLAYYRYSIIEDDQKEIVSEASIKKVDYSWPKHSDYPGYLTVNLGVGAIENKKLTIKIWRLPNKTEISTLIIYSKPVRPAKIEKIWLLSEFPKNRNAKSLIKLENYIKEIKAGDQVKITTEVKAIAISKQKTDIDFIYDVFLNRLNKDGQSMSGGSFNWSYHDPDGNPMEIIHLSGFNKVGNYEVLISPRFDGSFDLKNWYSLNTSFKFKIIAVPDYSRSKIITNVLQISGLLVLISLIAIIYIKRKNKRKLILANLKADVAKSQLSEVRARLNPHFVYNALSGVQNLINTNEVERANEYLSKFARLTRNVLDEEPMISIKEERILLDDYLSMEQLRFKFHYEIETDQSQNFENVEIPAMLLQPFVENAVKHGVSNLKERGKVTVAFIKEDKNLILTVADNGKGFNSTSEYEGLGLKLSKKRIALLNQTYPDCKINMSISSSSSNTQVIITLHQWL